MSNTPRVRKPCALDRVAEALTEELGVRVTAGMLRAQGRQNPGFLCRFGKNLDMNKRVFARIVAGDKPADIAADERARLERRSAEILADAASA